MHLNIKRHHVTPMVMFLLNSVTYHTPPIVAFDDGYHKRFNTLYYHFSMLKRYSSKQEKEKEKETHTFKKYSLGVQLKCEHVIAFHHSIF